MINLLFYFTTDKDMRRKPYLIKYGCPAIITTPWKGGEPQTPTFDNPVPIVHSSDTLTKEDMLSYIKDELEELEIENDKVVFMPENALEWVGVTDYRSYDSPVHFKKYAGRRRFRIGVLKAKVREEQ